MDNSKYPFVHLHNHTEYSLLDGSITINKIIEKTKEFGMESVAITDHGNMFGAFEFHKTAREHNIKPLIGCEVYITNSDNPQKDKNKDDIYHLVLLAKDAEGYSNLIDLVTNSHIEGFYNKPLIRKSYIENKTKGLIGLSACLKGEIASAIARNDDEKKALDLIDYYRSLFSNNDFYLELQDNNIDIQYKINDFFIKAHKKHNIPVVATNDVHFLEKSDWEAHNAILCIGTNKFFDDQKRMIFPDSLYFKSPKEMYDSFSNIPSALTNTLHIAEKCNFSFKTGDYHLPNFPIPEGFDDNTYLEYLAKKGLDEKISTSGSETDKYPLSVYQERLDYELRIMQQLKFSSYMLIVWDILNYCKKHNIGAGPGRGSAVGSLLCYCLDITEVDPIPFGLIFERFLNPDRESMPDIDIDICQEKRGKVINYLSKKYGQENVTQIITFSKLTSKAALKDVARVYKLPFEQANELTKSFPQEAKSISSAMKDFQEFKTKINKDNSLKEIVKIAQKVEGLTRHASVHAAGIIIADKPVSKYIPLYKTNKTPICTQLEYRQLEKLGLVKMDLLGLKAITLIDNILEMIDKKRNIKIDIKNIPLDDKKTFDLISSGNTTGVFQLESKGMQTLLTQAQPDSFTDIMPLLALYRPGPLAQKMNDVYVEGKKGKHKIEFDLPDLKDILSETYGVILYQEQVMKIANIIGGFSLSEADKLRKAMGKKKQDEMAKMKPMFIKNAQKNGYPKKKVEEIFAKMERFAEYGFNKSHSAGYSFITYRIAYLKANYTPYFFATLMTLDSNDKTKILKYINDCKTFNIDIVPPDINISENEFTVDDDKIIFGLRAISNLGTSAIESIIKARKIIKKFTDLYHFCENVDLTKVNKRVIENLIKSGAFDNISKHTRKENLYLLADAIQWGLTKQQSKRTGQRSLLDTLKDKGNLKTSPTYTIPSELKPETTLERLNYEFEALSYFISDHPIKSYLSILKILKVNTIESILEDNFSGDHRIAGIINGIENKTTKSKKKYQKITLEDSTGMCDILVWPDLYERKKDIIREMLPLIVDIEKDSQDQSRGFIAKDISPVESFITNKIEFIDINLDYDQIHKELCNKLESIIADYRGGINLRFHLKMNGNKVLIRLHPNYSVKYDNELFIAINQLLGKNNENTLVFRFV